MRYILILSAVAVCCAGCMPDSGFLIKPVPVSEKLTESALSSSDKGLFVYDKIAVIEVEGLIMNVQQSQGFMGPKDNPVSTFIEKLDKAQDDPNVKALIIRINSPGGGVTAADIMHNRLKRFVQERKVPVIAIIEDVGASGGYYIACGADTIMAHPTSVTGSIGVIIQTVSFWGTMGKLGIDAVAIKSGKMKDMGSPFKPLDEKDQAVLQTTVDDFYAKFLQVVKDGRPNLTKEQIAALADGRIYTADQAKDKGLVDSLGYMQDAVALAKTRAGISKAKVVMYSRPYGEKENFYSATQNPPPQMNMINISVPNLMEMTQPQILYLWTGKN